MQYQSVMAFFGVITLLFSQFIVPEIRAEKIYNEFQKGPTPFFAVDDYDEKNNEAARIGTQHACGVCHTLLNMVEHFQTDDGKEKLNAIVEGLEKKLRHNASYSDKVKAAAYESCKKVPQGKQVVQDEALRVCNNVVELEVDNIIDDIETGTSLDHFCSRSAGICKREQTRDHMKKAMKVWAEAVEEEKKKKGDEL